MGPKRKRGDRTWSQDSNDGGRPSPHQPGNLNMAQHGRDYQYDGRGRGRGRGGRGGGRGGYSHRGSYGNYNSPQNNSRYPSNSGPISPGAASNQPSQNPPDGTPAPSKTPQPSVSSSIAPPPAPTPSAPEPQIPDESALITFTYLTHSRLTNWKELGRQEIVDIGLQAIKDEDHAVLGSLYQEIIRCASELYVDPADLGETIKHVLEGLGGMSTDGESSFDAQTLFLDVLSIVTETDSSNIHLRALVTSTGISAMLMRQQLDAPLLQSLGLIRDTFARMGIRKQTNLIYRQSNYNLLREETEGFAKLVTELFTTASSGVPTSEVVEDTFERLKALIGAFDLDVGRVLDVVLDVFATVLVKEYRFFIKLLRASSWWPKNSADFTAKEYSTLPDWALPGSDDWATSEEERNRLLPVRHQRDARFWARVKEVGFKAFFELGRPVVEDQEDISESADEDETTLWKNMTGTVPPPGNRVAAQLLGFKLRFYTSQARDANDTLPSNLIYLSALLIKVGFISLKDLYPHLWPLDEKMNDVREAKTKELEEKERLRRPGGGALNALMMAGALSDDTVPISAAARLREQEISRSTPSRAETPSDKGPAGTKQEEQEQLPEPTDQKVQLLKSLLAVGAIPESLFMLGRFPWLLDTFPEFSDYIHRILHYSLSKVFDNLQPLPEEIDIFAPSKVLDDDQSKMPKGHINLTDPYSRKTRYWAELEHVDDESSLEYKYYWQDWSDCIPVCQSVDDVFSLCATFLNLSGVKIGRDSSLVSKLARIGKASLNEDPSDQNLARWADLCKRLLVPSLSLVKANPGVVNEVFELLKQFSTQTRYTIYAEWYTGQISRLPDMKSAFDQARAETKDVLKRISKTNVKPMARALAKVAYASPGIVFQVALSQIEAYDNLVEVVVECARYFTFLGYDVLTWSLMSSLGGKGRNRVQADGMLTSKWLGALSLFAGRVFKRYSTMNPTPILQYVTDQLQKNNTVDLIVLKEIISAMAGIVADTNFNESQTQAMAGGELLRSQTLLQLLDKRHESKTTARRLMKALIDPKLADQLLISIAQERQTCIFKINEPDAHLKLLGNLFDEVHRVLSQYLDLLRSNLSPNEFDASIPGVASLILDFHLEPNVAFWIARPSIANAMAEAEKSKIINEVVEEKLANQSEDVEMIDPKPNPAEPSVDVTGGASPVKEDTVMTEMGDNDSTPADITSAKQSPVPAPSGAMNGVKDPWNPVLKELMEEIRPTQSEETWGAISLPFYVTFWQLSLYDIYVPTQSYEDEINRLKRRLLAVTSDRSDVSIVGLQRKDKDKKSLNDLQDRLRAELKAHVQAFSQTRSRLQKEKDQWFADQWGKWEILNDAIIQYCFFPRILISSEDALFCFRMLKFLHSSGAPNFRTIGVIDKIFREKRLISSIFLCTSREAENLGKFLNELLHDLSRWHADKAIYEKEAFGPKKDLNGFAMKMNATDKVPESFLDYEDFRRLLYKWHRNLHNALKSSFEGGEYMHIRNAIIILKAVHQYFPTVNYIGNQLVAAATDLSKNETREDLKIAATSLLGNLKRREKQWVPPHAFNLIEKKEAGSRATSARPVTPQVDKDHPRGDADGSKLLNATAPEFQPKTVSHINGTKVQTNSAKMEVEDGEIEDAKMTTAGSTDTSTSKPASSDVKEAKPATSQDPPQSLAPPTSTDIPGKSPSDKPNGDQTPSRTEATPSQREEREDVSSTATEDRVESSRENPSQPSLAESRPHQLPPRPEGQFPMRPQPPNRYSQGRSGGWHDDRDGRYADKERFDRLSRDTAAERPERSPFRGPQDRAPERPSGGYREREANWDQDRPGPRYGYDERFSHTQSLPKDSRPSSRDSDFNDRDYRGRPGQDPLGARYQEPHKSAPYNASMRPPQYPDKSTSSFATGDMDRNERFRRPRSRSPLGPADRRPLGPSGRFDDRIPVNERGMSQDLPRSGRDRYDDGRPPAGPGPRSGRSNYAEGPPEADRSRELLRRSPPPRLATDPNHGRLNQESDYDPNYGRLNAGSDVPSGPRGRHVSNRQQSSQSSAPLSEANTVTPTPSDRQPPTGPSGGRATRSASQYEQASASAPATPSSESTTQELGGIHPDRLKAFQQDSTPVVRPTGAGNAAVVGNQTSNPPAGPRSSYGSTQSPSVAPAASPSTRYPPTGPSGPVDRGRGDKRFSNLQNVLNQTEERPPRVSTSRGRGGSGNYSQNPPFTPQESARPDLMSGRYDQYGSRGSGPQTPQTEMEPPYSREPRRDESRDSGDRRSTRHHSSRPQSESGSRDLLRPDDERGPPRRGDRRDSRGHPPRDDRSDRGGGGGRGRGRDDGGRDRGRGGRSMHDDDMGYTGDGGRSLRGPSDHRGDDREGGGSGRKRMRGGEDIPVEHSPYESKRPRRGA